MSRATVAKGKDLNVAAGRFVVENCWTQDNPVKIACLHLSLHSCLVFVRTAQVGWQKDVLVEETRVGPTVSFTQH